MKHLRVLSLGAGVQSTTLLLLSARGDLPTLDAAIFADTGWEPAAVYRHLDWLIPRATAAGIPIVRVSVGNIRADALRSRVRARRASGQRWAALPYYVDGADGREAMLRRQCTREYKLDPIRRMIRRLGGLDLSERAADRLEVEEWLGISDPRQQSLFSCGVCAT